MRPLRLKMPEHVEFSHARPVARKAGAFTLLEVLISVSLVAILATMLFLVLDATTRLWRETEKRIDSYREARVALSLMARELRSLFLLEPTLTNSWMVNPGNTVLPDSAAPQAMADSLFFTSLLPTGVQEAGKNRSELCAVGYFLAWTPDPGTVGTSSYKLYRHFKSSDDTFEALQNVATQRNLFLGVNSVVGVQNDIVARNIVELRVRPLRLTANGVLEKIDPWPNNERPAAIELVMSAINAETAGRLENRNEWENLSNPLVQQNIQTFTTRVTLPTIETPTAP